MKKMETRTGFKGLKDIEETVKVSRKDFLQGAELACSLEEALEAIRRDEELRRFVYPRIDTDGDVVQITYHKKFRKEGQALLKKLKEKIIDRRLSVKAQKEAEELFRDFNPLKPAENKR